MLPTEIAHWGITMAASYDVAVLVGSLRRGSYSGLLANALIGLAKEPLMPQIVSIGDLPPYNADHETDSPSSCQLSIGPPPSGPIPTLGSRELGESAHQIKG
jgi:hypothetical protein